MALPVYSTRFLYTANIVSAPSYTVPEGFVAVVRDLDASCPSPVTGYYVYLVNTTRSYIIAISTFPSDNNSAQWRGRQVIPAGESIALNGNPPTGATATVSGYLLTLP